MGKLLRVSIFLQSFKKYFLRRNTLKRSFTCSSSGATNGLLLKKNFKSHFHYGKLESDFFRYSVFRRTLKAVFLLNSFKSSSLYRRCLNRCSLYSRTLKCQTSVEELSSINKGVLKDHISLREL